MTRASKPKHPTPWVVDQGNKVHAMNDANGEWVGGIANDIAVVRRIVRAVNAYESPTAKAERAVVREAMRTDWGGDLTKLISVVDDLTAARAKAKRWRR